MNEIIEYINHIFNKEIYSGHVKKYGFDKQITVLGEECVELAKAVFKIKRYRENNPLKDFQWLKEDSGLWINFIEEYIDAYVMLKQFESYIDIDIAKPIIQEKYEKAYERIKGLF